MIKSMTGFGQAETDTETFNCKVEIKALNGKFLDINIRLPRNLQNKELELRNDLSKKLERGSISINVNITNKNVNDNLLPINNEVVNFYLKQINEISEKTGIQSSFLYKSIFDFPGVIQIKEAEGTNEEDWKLTIETIDSALIEFNNFRAREGENLSLELIDLCKSIQGKLIALAPFETSRVENIRAKIAKELSSLQTDLIDKNRFEQELIYYIEKLDINEEKSRLTEHCIYFLDTLQQETNGKKLGFIAQEMGREINTIGSKSNDSNMQRLVVEMKDNLEKIKEQINNIC
ncbi:MAG: YicC/YloC family endoribonuclease [Bacteroidota bacterium]|jgi:uncharacterized protein (TIGR00255 family)